MRTSDWSSDVCSSDLLADDHVLAIDRNAAELLLVAGVAHAVRGGAGAQHGQRGVRAEAEHLRVADAGLLADTDRHAGVGVAAVDAGNILLVQVDAVGGVGGRSEEHTSELQSLMRISYAVFCLKKKTKHTN